MLLPAVVSVRAYVCMCACVRACVCLCVLIGLSLSAGYVARPIMGQQEQYITTGTSVSSSSVQTCLYLRLKVLLGQTSEWLFTRVDLARHVQHGDSKCTRPVLHRSEGFVRT